MAVPKRRTSRANTRTRRSTWRATPPDLVTVRVAGVAHRVPRRLVRAVQEGRVDPVTGKRLPENPTPPGGGGR